jgi:hypothetical protein
MLNAATRAHARTGPRGQPLVFLGTVVLVWTLARIIHHWPEDAIAPRPMQLYPAAPTQFVRPWERLRADSAANSAAFSVADVPAGLPPKIEPTTSGRARTGGDDRDFDTAMAHHLLWAEALTSHRAPDARAGSPLADTPVIVAPANDGRGLEDTASEPSRRAASRRWSVYAWSLVRQGRAAQALAPGAQYGGSQAGLVIRHAFGQAAGAPVLYARAAGALASSADRTAAIGFSARPWRGVPVDLAVERRFGLARGQPDRFVAMAVAGGGATLRQSGIRVDGYGQAGIVGLDERLGFFDLQLIASRPVTSPDHAVVSVGGGIWAGGQQDVQDNGAKSWVHRVDAGPRAALGLPAGEGRLTLALDWRQRIDGEARPASGAVMTLSAGF